MKRQKHRKFIITACLAGMAMWGTTVAAQTDKTKTGNGTERLTIMERLAFRTNMTDWVLTTPNIGIQYDVTPWDYNKWTVGLNAKWNPGANQTFTPNADYKITEIKVEARKYFRQRDMKKKTPKFWRAYYWGVYAGYTDYTLMIKKGFKGEHAGVGATAGWEVQLHKFNTGALDLDLGLSAGWMYGRYDRTEADGNGGIRTYAEKDWHLIPFPMISEIKVALVYRFKPVSEKYKKSKQ